MPPQGETRKRSVGRRYSSFVTLHRRVGAGAGWVLASGRLAGWLWLKRLMHSFRSSAHMIGHLLILSYHHAPTNKDISSSIRSCGRSWALLQCAAWTRRPAGA